MQPFGEKYSQLYDLIYHDKDYKKEVDFLEEIFKRYGKPQKILDLACGTGSHAIELARRGYEVTGIDASKHMIGIAKEKAKRERVYVDFHVAKMQNFKLDEKFDCAIVMFSGMDYILRDKDVDKALSNIRLHLKENGILTFDFWHAPGVVRKRLSKNWDPVRVRISSAESKKIVRVSTTKIDDPLGPERLCKVRFDCIVVDNDVVDYFKEEHTLRYYSPKTMKCLLQKNGFTMLKMCPFMDLDEKIDDDTWNVSVIARC